MCAFPEMQKVQHFGEQLLKLNCYFSLTTSVTKATKTEIWRIKTKPSALTMHKICCPIIHFHLHRPLCWNSRGANRALCQPKGKCACLVDYSTPDLYSVTVAVTEYNQISHSIVSPHTHGAAKFFRAVTKIIQLCLTNMKQQIQSKRQDFWCLFWH